MLKMKQMNNICRILLSYFIDNNTSYNNMLETNGVCTMYM